MSKYVTKQRLALEGYLECHADQQLTAREIAAALEPQGISVSAVYRNLTSMVAEGKLRRILRDSCREAFYQYTDGEECRCNLHLICKGCGRTVHLGKEETDNLVQNISANKNFTIDQTDSVLYGFCERCHN